MLIKILILQKSSRREGSSEVPIVNRRTKGLRGIKVSSGILREMYAPDIATRTGREGYIGDSDETLQFNAGLFKQSSNILIY